MNPKGKVQAPKITETIERQCPGGWIPAWDPDESGPEWYYDKSKYFPTAPILREQFREMSPAPPPIPEHVSKAVLAWYAQQYKDRASQPTAIEYSTSDCKPSATLHSGQPLDGVGSTNLSPEPHTSDLGQNMRQKHIPSCPASNAVVKETSLNSTSEIRGHCSRRRKSSPAVALAASSTHHDLTRSPDCEGSSPPLETVLTEMKHPNMLLSEPSDTRHRHSVAQDHSSQEQRLSSSKHFVQFTSNQFIGSPTTSNITQPTDTSSGRPMSMARTTTMLPQTTTIRGPALEKQGHPRSEPLSREPSTASSSIDLICSAHEPAPGPTDKLKQFLALGSMMASVNARQTESPFGGIVTTLKAAAGQVPNASVAYGKRLRFTYEDVSETGTERPTKTRRISQNLHTIPGEQPPHNGNVLGCAHTVSRLANRAQPTNGTDVMDRIGQQQAPNPMQKGNVSISKADLVRKLVPGNTEVFADPRDPLVQEYIDAYTHNWLRGQRQMRAIGTQTMSDQGVSVPLGRLRALDQIQASMLKNSAFGLSQDNRTVNNAGIVGVCNESQVVDSTKPS